MSPKEDLEEKIREAYSLKCKYEEELNDASDPRQKQSIPKKIDEQQKGIQSLWKRYANLSKLPGFTIPDDIRQIALILELQPLPSTEIINESPPPISLSDTPSYHELQPHTVKAGMEALIELLRNPQVYEATVKFPSIFERVSEQIEILKGYKELHDLFHQLQYHHEVLYQNSKRLPSDEMAWDDIKEGILDIDEITTALMKITGQHFSDDIPNLWTTRLNQACANLQKAVQQTSAELLSQALRQINKILGREPSRINARLVATARLLNLTELIDVLTIINACREGQYLNQKVQEQFDTFANGITTLRHLDQCLKNLITTHDIFQEHNDELRPVIILIDHDIRALKDAWVTIATLMEYLCANKSVTWANRMNANGASVVAVLNQSNPNQTEIRRAFHRYYRYSSQGFNRVDKDLLDLCNELRLIGEPLKEVLKVFT